MGKFFSPDKGGAADQPDAKALKETVRTKQDGELERFYDLNIAQLSLESRLAKLQGIVELACGEGEQSTRLTSYSGFTRQDLIALLRYAEAREPGSVDQDAIDQAQFTLQVLAVNDPDELAALQAEHERQKTQKKPNPKAA